MEYEGESELSYMEKHYDSKYFFAERSGGKKYKDSAGQDKEFGYFMGGLWNFNGILDKLIELLRWPDSLLDIGAGCGGFVATAKKFGIESLGLEFSQFAIDNAILESAPLLKKWDIEVTPWPVDHQYDWVTAIDLFEHLFADKVDEVIKEAKRVAKRFIIAKICTAQRPHEVWSANRASYEEVYEQARREGFEWLVVSGHVNSQFPQYWINKFVDNEWINREDLAEKMKKDLHLPEDWRTTLILERKQEWP
jgi:ubiquinone/menaquinone biosynthesis C-methylase UbiE